MLFRSFFCLIIYSFPTPQLFFLPSAIQRDGNDLPRNKLPTLPQCGFRRIFQPAAAGDFHAHDGHALNVVIADDLGELLGIVHTIQLGAANKGDAPLDKLLVEGSVSIGGAVGSNK